jgi:inner membrane protein
VDTITHTLFGLALYGAINKQGMQVSEKRALLLTTVAGSQIPDIDVISSWWDTTGQYQMWHRGITHSIFLVPIWAAFLAIIARLFFRARGWKWFGIASLAVFIHDTSDLFNAWGTGYLEPFSSARITFGTIPIVDLVFWAAILTGWLLVKFGRSRWKSHKVFQTVWLVIALHVGIQSTQGYIHYQQAIDRYEQVALSADFVPGQFVIVGKKEGTVTLSQTSWWSGSKTITTLESNEDADLDKLFAAKPEARVLYEWSPFVVIVNDGTRLGIYDPRFYRNGESFLSEYMELD